MNKPLDQTNIYMKKAIELAKNRQGKTYPNPTVGCVILHENQIIAEACHERAGEAHAEKRAIQEYENESGPLPAECTVYVTLEPCSHQGKTPPCADLLIEKKIKKIFIGMKDPNPLVAGQGIQKLQNAGIEVVVGVLEKECRNLNLPFIKNMERSETYLSVKVATTLDGMVADVYGKSKWITGDEARQRGHQLRSETDGILTTIKTIKADNPSLNVRIKDQEFKNRVIILDKNLEFEMSSKVVEVNGTKNVFIVSISGNTRASELRKMGINIIELPAEESFYNTAITKILYQNGFCHILVEGGANLVSSFVENKLADDLHFFSAPVLLGSANQHAHFTTRLNRNSLDESLKLNPVSCEILGRDIYQHFNLNY